MGTEITRFEPIQPPDVRRPANLTKLPQWAQQRCDTLEKVRQPDQSGVWREVPTLPTSLILDKSQKLLIEKHAAALGSILTMTPEEDERHATLTMTTVTKMLVVLPSRETGDLAAEAKGEAYMAALEDVPSWAVHEAVRKWYRSEHGAKYDYKWQPGPSTLRELALIEQRRVMGIRRKLNGILLAEPLVEFSGEHETAMKDRVAAHLSMRKA